MCYLQHLALSQSRVSNDQDVWVPPHWDAILVCVFLPASKQCQSQSRLHELQTKKKKPGLNITELFCKTNMISISE